MWRRTTCALAGLLATACAAAPKERQPLFLGTGRDVITAGEIVASRVTDAYQAVAHLRPEFLRRRLTRQLPSFTPQPVPVYLDGLPFGSDADALRQIPLGRVRLIRYISPTDADLRYGGSHPAGAILVTTLKR